MLFLTASLFGCCSLHAQQQGLFYYYKGNPVTLSVNNQCFLSCRAESRLPQDLWGHCAYSVRHEPTRLHRPCPAQRLKSDKIRGCYTSRTAASSKTRTPRCGTASPPTMGISPQEVSFMRYPRLSATIAVPWKLIHTTILHCQARYPITSPLSSSAPSP